MLQDLNYVAILVTALLTFILGYLWYGPLFGDMWMKLSGKSGSEGAQKNMAPKMLAGYGIQVAEAIVIALAIEELAIVNPVKGVQIALIFWLGFIATITFGNVLWEGKSPKLWLLNNAYYILQAAIMGGIIAVWV